MPTVACEKLVPLFSLNNWLNIQRRTLKPLAICFHFDQHCILGHPIGHHKANFVAANFSLVEKQEFYFFSGNCNGG